MKSSPSLRRYYVCSKAFPGASFPSPGGCLRCIAGWWTWRNWKNFRTLCSTIPPVGCLFKNLHFQAKDEVWNYCLNSEKLSSVSNLFWNRFCMLQTRSILTMCLVNLLLLSIDVIFILMFSSLLLWLFKHVTLLYITAVYRVCHYSCFFFDNRWTEHGNRQLYLTLYSIN